MRRIAVVVALLLVAGAAAVGAVRADARPPSPAATQPQPANTTPLLSARRLPWLLASSTGDERLRTELDNFVQHGAPQSCLIAGVGGQTAYDRNPDLPLMPASNQKLVTATAALAVLGAGFRYTTTVSAAGAPAGGTVKGDLWLVGGGDPLVATKAFADRFHDSGPYTLLDTLADRVAAAGIRHITGRVVGDESRYDQQRTVPSWPPRYAAQNQSGPLSALAVDHGYTAWPPTGDLEGNGAAVRAVDPAAAAAGTFADLLRARGIAVDGGSAVGIALRGAAAIARIESAPLGDIVGEMLRESDNQTAELVTKELGAAKAGSGTTQAGVGVMADTIRGLGLPVAGWHTVDGSGLDAADRATCRLLQAVLVRAGPQSPIGSGLPVAGVTGTLQPRFVGTPAAGHLRAKTGTLPGVSSLSGFVDTVQGVPITFSYIGNGQPVTAAVYANENALGTSLSVYPDGIDLAALGPEPVSP